MSPRLKATLLVAAIMYEVLLYSVFAEPAFWVRVFGPEIAGRPAPEIAAASVTLFFLPG